MLVISPVWWQVYNVLYVWSEPMYADVLSLNLDLDFEKLIFFKCIFIHVKLTFDKHVKICKVLYNKCLLESLA